MHILKTTGYSLALSALCFLPASGKTSTLAELKNLGPGGGGTLGALAMAPDDTNIVYAGLDCGGMHLSLNNGRVWENINDGIVYKGDISFNDHYGMLGLENNAVLATSDDGVIYRSENNGRKWQEVFTAPDHAPIGAIIRDSHNPKVIYAMNGRGRWEYFSSILKSNTGRNWGGSIYISNNLGKKGSWRKLNTDDKNNIPAFAHISSMAIDSGNAKRMYASTSFGMYRSDDGGVSWQSIQKGLGDIIPKTVAAGTPDTILVSVMTDQGQNTPVLYKSTDAGNTWRPSSNGLTGSEFQTVTVDPRNPKVFYLGSRTWGGAVFYSKDSGDSWKLLFNTEILKKKIGANTQPYNNWHPDDRLHVSCATNLIIGGEDRNKNGISDTIFFSGDNLGIIWKSDNEGQTWSQLTTTQVGEGWIGKGNIDLLCARRITVDPRNPKHLLVVDWDWGIFESFDGGAHFKLSGGPWYNGQLLGGCGSIALDPDNPGIVYVGSKGGVIMRYPGKYPQGFFNIFGAHRNSERGLPSTTSYANGLLIVKQQENGKTVKYLYVAAHNLGIWRINLDDPNAKFQDSGKGLENTPESHAFSDMVISQPSGTFFAGSFDGIYRSTDGKNWQRITGAKTAAPNIDGIIGLSVDPNNPKRIYASRMKTYRETPGDGIYCSEDLGNTWTQLANIVMPYCVAVIPGKTQSILTGSQALGVYRITKSVTGKWKVEHLTADYPQHRVSRVWGITVDPHNPKHFFIATHGNFIYEGKLK